MSDFRKRVKFEIEKISPKAGDFVMIRVLDDQFDKFGPDELNQLAQELSKEHLGVRVFFASESYRLELINKTQIAELGLTRKR